MKFKNLAIGDKFYGYGDFLLNDSYPKKCILEKISNFSAREIVNGKPGIIVSMDENDDYEKL